MCSVYIMRMKARPLKVGARLVFTEALGWLREREWFLKRVLTCTWQQHAVVAMAPLLLLLFFIILCSLCVCLWFRVMLFARWQRRR